MAKNIKSYQEPTHEEIATLAQGIYESEGRPEGKAVEHWLQAEAQIIAERKAQAGAPIAKPAATSNGPTASPAATANRNPKWPTPPRQPVTHN